MSLTGSEWKPDTSVYQHAIGTQAVCEYYAMTQDEAFKELVLKTVAYIVDGQNPSGGWDLYYAKGPRSDLSVTTWQVQALHAARLTRLPIPGLDQALAKSVSYIKKMPGNEGGFGYDKPENRLDLTGAGIVSLYLTTNAKDHAVKEGIDFLLGKAKVEYKGRNTDLYGWYFDTQACYRFGGSAWSKWNRMFQAEIADSQSPDGSWPPTNGNVYERLPDGAGPYFRTVFCTLMLEVFYRSIVEPSQR